MTNCSEIFTLIERVADNEATERERRLVAEHIDQCDKCRQIYDLLAELQETLSNESQPPETLTPCVMDAVRLQRTPEKVKTPPSRRWTRYIALAACLVIVAAGALKLANTRMGSTGSSAADNGYAANSVTTDSAGDVESEEAAPEITVKDDDSVLMGSDGYTQGYQKNADDADGAPQSTEALPEGYGGYFLIYGDIPGILEEYEVLSDGDINYIEITPQTADELESMGYERIDGEGEGIIAV
ncbi:MAG: zf-HC2 domain-containing protein, partial [Oscillospiraceae bacterium]|nr:zf-HC2 domain-containing protein [Oscillospiraceae bacterium]